MTIKMIQNQQVILFVCVLMFFFLESHHISKVASAANQFSIKCEAFFSLFFSARWRRKTKVDEFRPFLILQLMLSVFDVYVCHIILKKKQKTIISNNMRINFYNFWITWFSWFNFFLTCSGSSSVCCMSERGNYKCTT